MRQFFDSREFADKPYWASVMVMGMIVHADDDGFHPGDTEWIKRRYLSRGGGLRGPGNAKIQQVLDALAASKMLTRCKCR